MQIFRFLFRKMWSNRWLTGSSLLGLIIAVALTTSIPMYTDGSMQRFVNKELEAQSEGLPAGSMVLRYQRMGSEKAELDKFNAMRKYVAEEVTMQAGFPNETLYETMGLRNERITPVDPDAVDPSRRREMGVGVASEVEKQIEIVQGRMYSDKAPNGVIEAIVPEDALHIKNFSVGTQFRYPVQGKKPLVIEVVGAYQVKNPDDTFWFQGTDRLNNQFLVSETVFLDEILQKQEVPLGEASWYLKYNLGEMKTKQIAQTAKWLKGLDYQLNQVLPYTKVEISFYDTLEYFRVQNQQMKTLLFTLVAPILVLVFYYVSMNSRQALERQQQDIATLRSRGGSTKQIFWLYLLEGIILGLVALFVGGILGFIMAKSIGSSSGFLEFVSRKTIPIEVSLTAILYGLAAVLFAVLASVIPAIQYAKQSIVNHKQEMARKSKKPFWYRFGFDFILLGVAGYGWYLFKQRELTLVQTGLTADQLQVHPLTFFVPALSLFAVGLLFLRLFPFLLKSLLFLSKKYAPTSVYLGMTQLARSARQYHPIMLLLVLTLGLGVYNSSAARTIDMNSNDRLWYQNGADVVLQAIWEGHADQEALQKELEKQQGGNNNSGGSRAPGGRPGSIPGQGGIDYSRIPIRYVEPPFEIYRNMEGVEEATRVYKDEVTLSVAKRSLGKGNMMAIDNDSFYKVAQFRDGLNPATSDKYLNGLGVYAQGVIISDKFAKENGIEPGHQVNLIIQQQPVEFVVVATVPYWPTLNPNDKPFFITNLSYIHEELPMRPYEVWFKMQDGGSVRDLVYGLADKGIYLSKVVDTRTDQIIQNKHPSRGGVYGILSLGFLISILISLLGYVLFWFFSLRARTLQFGVLRAIGLTRRQLTTTLMVEQLLTAGLSIFLGIVAGRVASYAFLPFLQSAEGSATQVPPFRVVFEQGDLTNMFVVVLIMMAIGVGLLVMRMRSLRIHQAVKLGEER